MRYQVYKKCGWMESTTHESRTLSLEISTGNPKCSGRFLVLVMNWARQYASSFVFSVGDTLRIHNYVSVGHPEHGLLTPSEAGAVARAEGTAWYEANASAIGKYFADCEVEIVRWDDWKAHPDFEYRLAVLEHAYASDVRFADTIRSDLRKYLNRQGLLARPRRPDESLVLDQLANYLLEELAVYSIQADTPATVNVYPGSQMNVFKEMSTFESVPPSLKVRHYAYLEIH